MGSRGLGPQQHLKVVDATTCVSLALQTRAAHTTCLFFGAIIDVICHVSHCLNTESTAVKIIRLRRADAVAPPETTEDD